MKSFIKLKSHSLCRALCALATISAISVTAGCALIDNNPQFKKEMDAARSITVVIPPAPHISVTQTERSLFYKFKRSELEQAERTINEKFQTILSVDTGNHIAAKLREQGYSVNLITSEEKQAVDFGSDVTLKILAFSVTIYAEADALSGKRYRIVMGGTRLTETRSQRTKDVDQRYYPYARDQSQGIIESENVTNVAEFDKQFRKTMDGWVRTYIEGTFKKAK
jgi:hypothetical protein